MKKEILKSKMMLIALSSILFVSCGGGGGGGGGASNLPVNPGTNPGTPSTPTTIEGTYPTVDTGLDKSNMSALKTNLYNAQRSSGASIPKDTSTVDGSGVKVAVLDSNFVDAVRTGANSAEDDDGNSITARRNKTLTYMYESVEIVNPNPNHPYIEDSNNKLVNRGTEKPTGLEHGEEVLEVIGDLKYAPNNLATTLGATNKANNKIGVILGSVGWDYQYTEGTSTKKRIGGILPTQEVYEAAMAKFGNQSVKIFNQSFGSDDPYDSSKFRTYRGEGNIPLTFEKMNSGDQPNFMLPYFRNAVENKGGLFIWSAGNKANQNASLEAGLPYFDHRLEAGWIAAVGVSAKKGSQYNVLDDLSKAGSEAAYWSISADEDGVLKITSISPPNGSIGSGSSYAAPRVTRAAALVYDKFDWMTANQIRQTLFTTTDKTELNQNPATMSEANLRNVTMFPDSTYGWGMLNEKRALKGPGAFMDVTKYGDTSIFKANLPAGKVSYFDNDIYGNGGLEKLGAGTLHLTGNNSFSGGSTVTAGTLEIHQIHSSPITVGAGGTLVLNPKAIVGYDTSGFSLIGTVNPQEITHSGIKVKNYGNVKFNGNTAIIGGDYVAYNGSNTQVGFKNSVKVLGNIRIENANISILSNDYVTKNELRNKNYLTEHQDISGLATKEQLKKAFLDDEEHEKYAKKSELPQPYNDTDIKSRLTTLENRPQGSGNVDTSNFATKSGAPYVSSENMPLIGYLSQNSITRNTSNFGKLYSDAYGNHLVVSGREKTAKFEAILYTAASSLPDYYEPDFDFSESENIKFITTRNIRDYIPANTGNTIELDKRLKVLEAKQWEIHGRGLPNGVVTAPVGTTYVDEAVTNGALKWIKKTGTGNVGWEVLIGDTGWKIIPSVSKLGGSYVKVRRVNNIVSYQFGGLSWGWFGIVRRGGAGYQVQPSDRERNCFILGLSGIPIGYRSEASLIGGIYNDKGTPYGTWYLGGVGDGNMLRFQFTDPVPTDRDIGDIRVSSISYLTSDPWPAN